MSNNNNIDRLFRDKLKYHPIRPSGDAWDKISNNLQKRKGKAIWIWASAAAIALVCISITAVMYMQSGTEIADKQVPESDQSIIESNEKELLAEEMKPNLNDKTTAIQRKSTDKPIIKNSHNDVIQEKAPGKNPPKENQVANIETKTTSMQHRELKVQPIPIQESNQIAENLPDIALEKGKTPPAKQEKMAITIIYKSGNKNKQSLMASDTGNKEESKSTLEKIVDKAKEIKSSDLGLAGLREAKDELLALEPKVEKSKKH